MSSPNSIVKGWRRRRIKAVADVRYGLGQPPERNDEGLPIIRATNVSRGKITEKDLIFVDPDDLPLGRDPYLKTGEIIVVRSGAYTGDSSIIPEKWNGAIAGYDMVVSATRCDPRYLAYCLLSYSILDSQILLLTQRAAQPHLNANELGNVIAELPDSIPEQKRIAAYLDASCAAIDRAVETKQKQLETLDALRKSIIQRAVTQGLNPDVEMKDSGVKYLGQVPSHWRVSKMKRLLSEPLSYGLNESGTDEIPGDPRYIRITDFGRDGELRDETFRSLPPDVAAGAPLQEGDILLARSGATVGKSFLFSNFKGAACYAGYLIKARTAPHLLNPKYLYLYTRSLSYEAWKDQIFSQATIQNISAVKYAYLETPVPPSAEQIQIMKFLDSEIEKTADLENIIQKQITTLTAYRKSLIHECVTGKRRISDADVARVEAHD